MPIDLIDKIAPKNAAFTGMVDAKEVIGDAGSNTLPDATVASSNVTQHQGNIDHGSIAGLGDDDHTQYHTDTRASTWLNTKGIDELSDVIITAPVLDQVLQYNGSNWVNATFVAGVTDHGGLTGLSDDDHTQYHTDSRADTWFGTKNIEALSNVTITTPSSGQVLQYNGSIWVNATPGSETDHGTLTGLGDDDHTQYLLVAGTRAMTGNLDMGTFAITNVGNVDGVDVSTLNSNYTNHAADSTIHFTEASIDHTAISNIGTNTHAQIDTHIADSTIHFTEASIDHTAISNIGTNTHAQIDTHIADSTLHFTEASIDHGSIAGLSDDDHTQYLLANGTRAMSGALQLGTSKYTIGYDSGNTRFAIKSSVTTNNVILINDSSDKVIMTDDLEVQGEVLYRTPTTHTPTLGSIAVDLSTASAQYIDLSSSTSNIAVTLSNPQVGGSYIIEFKQHGTTPRTLTWAGGTFKFESGIDVGLTATAGAIDIVSIFYNNSTYYVSYINDWQTA